jgi:hypothetical protein
MPRLNYTGRKKINKRDVKIKLINGEKSFPYFRAELDISPYQLPSDATVHVEAYRQTSWMRFPFGTVDNIKPPKDTYLTQFDSGDAVRFRVKVTQEGNPHGMLLAVADKIKPKTHEDEEEKESLLPVKSENIRSVWKLDFTDDGPLLLVSKKAGDKDSIVLSQEFRLLAMPAIFREILKHISFVDEPPEDINDPSDWRACWLKYAEKLIGENFQEYGEYPEDKIQFIDEAVEEFSISFRDIERFKEFWEAR